ncbi:MAG: helix-turn-helix domain-containing protein [Lachnospiraceae bacterium]|nr:helix-turn-helix domain-containing protein [Lachnospiraceae bacterium]
MKNLYTINELANMTMLSTRTLRNYLKAGILSGEKIDGVWQFNEEDINVFLQRDFVKPSLEAKRNNIVFDFLADTHKNDNSICMILDYHVNGGEEAGEIQNKYLQLMNSEIGKGVVFSYYFHGEYVRVILRGTVDCVEEIRRRYTREDTIK